MALFRAGVRRPVDQLARRRSASRSASPGSSCWFRPGGSGSGHWQTLVVLLAPVLWAIGSLYAPEAPSPRQPLTAIAMEMIAGGLLLGVAGVATGELGRVHLGNISFASIAAFVYLVLIGALGRLRPPTSGCSINVSVTAASTYAFVNPVVAVALGAVVLGEQVTPLTLVAATPDRRRRWSSC